MSTEENMEQASVEDTEGTPTSEEAPAVEDVRRQSELF